MLEIIIIIFLSLILIAVNAIPYIAGVLTTPAGTYFLGTVHWPGDYFYYLSQMTQGANGWMWNYDLYTADFPKKVLVGWVNTFVGRIFYLFRVDPVLSYQISVAFFSFTFLFVSYLLIREIFPSASSRAKRIIAFIFFAYSNATPIIIDLKKWSFTFHDYWYTNGIPFNRLGGVPHHVLGRTFISLGLLLGVLWWKRLDRLKVKSEKSKVKNVLYIFSMTFTGFILGSVDPTHWGLVFGTLMAVPGIYILLNFLSSPNKSKRFNPLYFLPGFLVFLGGLPIVSYLSKLFGQTPYIQLRLWEGSQQVNIKFHMFLLANGPVFILGLIGLIFFLRKFTLERLLVVFFLLTPMYLMFSQIPYKLNIVNVRFFPAQSILMSAIIAADFLFWIPSIISGKNKFFTIVRKSIPVLSLIALLIILAPSYIAQVPGRAENQKWNSFFYIPDKAYDMYKYARDISNIKDSFLVQWPFNWSFPGITGRRIYYGHSLLTSDYAAKEKAAYDFLLGRMTDLEMQKFMERNKLKYVIAYPDLEALKNKKFLSEEYNNGFLVMYKYHI